MELNVAAKTDTGRIRDQNEDSVLTDLPLVAVADGMGGHEGGEVASKLALEVLARFKPRLYGKQGTAAAETLREALIDANKAVWDRAKTDESVAGMGTTLTAAWLEGGIVALAHVGDSRAYLLRGGKLEKLTEDQTVAAQWVRQGRLSEDEAASSPQRHILLQAVGTDARGVNVEIASLELQSGDRLLIASDGLHGMLKTNDRIRDVLAEHHDPDEACAALVAAANAAGGEDNISVVIVDAGAGEAHADAEGAPVVVERPTAAKSRFRLGGKRIAIGAGVAAAALVAAGVLWFQSSPSYVVSVRQGSVVILDGRPGSDDKPAHGRVVRVFSDAPLDKFPPTVQRDLRSGIPVSSLAEADRVVANLLANLPRLLGPQETPATPTPSSRSLVPKPTASHAVGGKR
jgi:protein phosphatase